MSTIHRALFAVDFSLGCEALVPTVRRMIECWHTEVTLLHVMEAGHWFERRHELEGPMTLMRTIAGEGLRAPDVRCRLERGDPATRILEYVWANHVDLVALSAGGSPSIHGTIVGSVADRVLADAPCPVWLDWGSARSRATAGMYSREVCCALELNEADEYVLRGAADLTLELGANLTMVHAVTPPAGKPLVLLWDRSVRERKLNLAKERLENLRQRFLPSARITIEIGPSHTVVGRAIQNAKAGLLVTGNWRDAVLAAEAECPVLRLVTPATATVYSKDPRQQYATAARRGA